MVHILFRKAKLEDLDSIIQLLIEDELGQEREENTKNKHLYIDAFNKINSDSNQYLMIVEYDNHIIGTCHLTIIPSLTFKGSSRLQIEAVRIDKYYRNKNIGKMMMKEAIQFGQNNNANIIQLTTNKLRTQAKRFYEKIGFKASHEGMKMYL